MSAPLLEAHDARLDEGGVPQIDGLSFATKGDRVLVLGAAPALFEAVSGAKAPTRGAVKVRGDSATLSLAKGRVAGAPLDPPLPPEWTPRAYTSWSVRLAGKGGAAEAFARDALERMKLSPYADAPLRKAAMPVRRATVIASALATGAPVVMLEDPTAGLADADARAFEELLAVALEGRAWVVFAPKVALASPFALAADDVVTVQGSQVLSQGTASEVAARSRAFALKVHGNAEAFARSVESRGLTVARNAPALVVELGTLPARDLLSMALEAGAVIVEMSPVGSLLE